MLQLDGTVRAVTPEETLAKIDRPEVYERVGLTRVADLGRLDFLGLHVFAAFRPNGKALSSGQGKGVSKELAKVSAIMEAIETWHAEFLRPADAFGTTNELKAEGRNLRPWMESQIGDGWPLDPDRTTGWIEGRAARTDEPVLIPREQVCLAFDEEACTTSFGGSTNGLASGNTFDEAVVHGLLEVVERQAEVLVETRLGEINPPLIDTRTIETPSLRALIDEIESRGIHVVIEDRTEFAPGGIPTMAAYLEETDILRGIGKMKGSGSHLSPRVAIARAITEAVQARVVMISGSRDDFYPSFYESRRQLTMEDQGPIRREGTKQFVDNTLDGRTFADLRTEILDRLEANGFGPVTVIDLTDPVLDIPVASVTIEGCGFRHRSHQRPRMIRL